MDRGVTPPKEVPPAPKSWPLHARRFGPLVPVANPTFVLFRPYQKELGGGGQKRGSIVERT
jgi:hypothetical protein